MKRQDEMRATLYNITENTRKTRLETTYLVFKMLLQATMCIIISAEKIDVVAYGNLPLLLLSQANICYTYSTLI